MPTAFQVRHFVRHKLTNGFLIHSGREHPRWVFRSIYDRHWMLYE